MLADRRQPREFMLNTFSNMFSEHGSDSSRVGGVWGYASLGNRWKIILFDPDMVGQGRNHSTLEFEAEGWEVEIFLGYHETARKPWGT
jgi:hypothetical protein